MRNYVLIVMAILLMAGVIAAETDYEVIEVGGTNYPAASMPKWSPDGTKLALIRGKTLCVSDTLGNIREIRELELYVRKYEWIDNYALAMSLVNWLPGQDRGREDERFIQFCEVPLDGEISVLRTHHFTVPVDRVFYLQKGQHGSVFTYERPRVGDRSHNLLSVYDTPERKKISENDFTVGVTEAGIYKIDLATGDSTLIMKNEKGYSFNARGERPLMNYKEDLILLGRDALVILNLNDSSEVILGDYLGEPPEGFMYCQFVDISICPTDNVLVFVKTCYKDEYTETASICMYNYDTDTYTSFPSLTGSEVELFPQMSSDGRHIAFYSMSKGLCILKLGVGDEK